MTNGLITKVFSLKPDFASLDYYSHEKQASLLRALMPEAVISLGGLRYNIGGLQGNIPYAYLNRSALNVTVDPNAFHFYKYNITEVEAPFPYTPMRGAPSSIKWPPPGEYCINYLSLSLFPYMPMRGAPSSINWPPPGEYCINYLSLPVPLYAYERSSFLYQMAATW